MKLDELRERKRLAEDAAHRRAEETRHQLIIIRQNMINQLDRLGLTEADGWRYRELPGSEVQISHTELASPAIVTADGHHIMLGTIQLTAETLHQLLDVMDKPKPPKGSIAPGARERSRK